MKTLTVELPMQTALKLEALEQQHGARLRQVLAKMIATVLEKIETSPETELRALEETLAVAAKEDELEFQAIANYLMDKNAELYRRLA